jgi:ribose transport system permease protein
MLNLKKDTGLLVLIVVVGTVVAFINPRFLSSINIANTANLVGLFGMFSIAEAFVIITGGIELSVGSMIALLGVIFVDFIANRGVPWPLAAGIVLSIGLVLGLIHGFLVTRMQMQPFVVTLCGLLIYRGVARFYTEDATAGFPFGVRFDDLEYITTGRTDLVSVVTGGAYTSVPIPHAFFFMLVLAAIMWVVLHRSVFGRYLYAVGKNEEAARFSGIRTTRVIIAAYIICAMLTALSAIFLAMYTRSILPSSHGNFYELYAIAAAVLGGFSLRGGEGSIIGVVLGTILLQVLQNLVNLLGIPSSLNFAVSGSVILIGVLADQEYAKFRRRGELRRSQSAAHIVRTAPTTPIGNQ